MSDRAPRKRPKELSPEERMKRDARMAAALKANVTHDDFRSRFGPGSLEEIPRIREQFRIKPAAPRTHVRGWA